MMVYRKLLHTTQRICFKDYSSFIIFNVFGSLQAFDISLCCTRWVERRCVTDVLVSSYIEAQIFRL